MTDRGEPGAAYRARSASAPWAVAARCRAGLLKRRWIHSPIAFPLCCITGVPVSSSRPPSFAHLSADLPRKSGGPQRGPARSRPAVCHRRSRRGPVPSTRTGDGGAAPLSVLRPTVGACHRRRRVRLPLAARGRRAPAGLDASPTRTAATTSLYRSCGCSERSPRRGSTSSAPTTPVSGDLPIHAISRPGDPGRCPRPRPRGAGHAAQGASDLPAASPPTDWATSSTSDCRGG